MCFGAALLATVPFALERYRADEPPPPAPVELEGPEMTVEQLMLEVSQQERYDARIPSKEAPVYMQWAHRIRWVMVRYIIEPVATGWRLLTLVAIFGPVVVSIPVVWMGRRVEGRSGEREGMLWWYWYLVWSLERAGPTFIKVGFFLYGGEGGGVLMGGTVGAVGGFEDGYFPDGIV